MQNMWSRCSWRLISFLIIINTGLLSKGFCVDKLTSELKLIHPRERFYLSYFFKELVFDDGLGYILFGDKPICISGYLVNSSSLIKPPNTLNFKKGYALWKKHEAYFSHPNFIFIDEPLESRGLQEFEQKTGDKLEFRTINIINKKEFINIINQNKDIFDRELGYDIDPELLLQEISSKKIFFPLINNHEGLLGILLGYGVESSMEFYRNEKENLNFYNETNPLKPISDISFGNIQSIQFVGNPESQEVQEILTKNRVQRKNVFNIYSKGDFLEITLNKLKD